MKEQIIEGLKKLDTSVDAHWTQEGLPNLNSFKFLAGVTTTREELEENAPGFNRDNASTYFEEKSEVVEDKTESIDPVVEANDQVESLAKSEMRIAVDINFSDAVKSILELLDTNVDVTTLSIDELSEINSSVRNRIDNLNAFLSDARCVVSEQTRYLHSISHELDRRTPKMQLHEMVKAVHASNCGTTLPCDAPRARVTGSSLTRR